MILDRYPAPFESDPGRGNGSRILSDRPQIAAGRAADPDAGRPGGCKGYDLFARRNPAEVGPFLDDVYAMAAACGVAVDAATSESGPSQYEFNLDAWMALMR